MIPPSIRTRSTRTAITKAPHKANVTPYFHHGAKIDRSTHCSREAEKMARNYHDCDQDGEQRTDSITDLVGKAVSRVARSRRVNERTTGLEHYLTMGRNSRRCGCQCITVGSLSLSSTPSAETTRSVCTQRFVAVPADSDSTMNLRLPMPHLCSVIATEYGADAGSSPASAPQTSGRAMADRSVPTQQKVRLASPEVPVSQALPMAQVSQAAPVVSVHPSGQSASSCRVQGACQQ